MGNPSQENQSAAWRVTSSAQDLARRVADGSLSEQFVKSGLERLKDGLEIRPPRKLSKTPVIVIDEAGFEKLVVPYAPSFQELKTSSGFGWNGDVTEERFKRRPFEQADGEILTKLHAPNRLIWSMEAMLELEDMGAAGATIREGVEWAKSHKVTDYPSNIVIALLGSAWQSSGGSLYVPYLYQSDGRWYVNCYWHSRGRWDASVQFLAVRRRKFQH